ncbi:MAG: gliding motility-associated C-terminal domain-containing protein [Saprospiraceae bacterium]|nr:gliding motility-associated C-terminal domain-containing protein [Saprospiraceae bacterium]
MNLFSELSCWLILIGLALPIQQEEAPTPSISPASMMEVCDNGLDDDGDGQIDAFDPDCQCSGRLSPNLVPNGQFNETTGCCTDLGQVNCLTDWVVLGPSPDYISDNCSDNNLRPDVRFLANALNQGRENDGYIFGVAQVIDGRQFTESMGVCLDSPMEAGKTYEVSFQLANLRNDSPDLLFSLVGIDLCSRLPAYDTRGDNSFCERQLPVTQLGAVNAMDLNQGWNTLTFEVVPEEKVEAILYTVECGFNPSTPQATLYMVMDAVSIREQLEPPLLPDIVLNGQPCLETLSLSVPFQPGSTYQWYRDSIPIQAANDTILQLTDDFGPHSGIYHVLIRDLEGNCDLTEPFELILPELQTQILENICAGEVFNFGGTLIDSDGIYWDTLSSVWGCDSIVQLQLEVSSSSVQTLTQSICAGENYAFAGALLSATGEYQDTLINALGCDSVIHLDLMVMEEIQLYVSDTICEGSQYSFGSQVLTTEGVYRDTLQSAEGCDSIISIQLAVLDHSLGDTLFVSQPLGTEYNFMGNLYSSAGLYEAVLTAANGCDSTSYLALTFYDPCTLPLMLNAASTAASCDEAGNGQIEAIVEGAFPPYTYVLDNQFAQDSPAFAGLFPGSYILAVEDSFGCTTSTTVEVSFLDNFLQVDVGPDTSVFLGEQIDLEPVSLNFASAELVWSSDQGSVCQACPVLSITPIESTLYQLEAIDEWGCSAIDDIWVEVIPPPQYYIPNAFSPNEDGINDVFQIGGSIEAMDRIEGMKIFSRWGDLLFEVDGQNQGKYPSWDGFVKGKEAALGVYVYTIHWRDFRGEIQLLVGDVLLLR